MAEDQPEPGEGPAAADRASEAAGSDSETIKAGPPVEVGFEEDDAGDEVLEADEDLDVIELVRIRLGLGDEPSDVTIAASLAAISAKGEARARWLTAFSSPLGKWLAMSGADLNTALDTVLALAPKPPS